MQDFRHNARMIALQKLFESSFQKELTPNSKIDIFPVNKIQEINETKSYNKDLLDTLLTNFPKYEKEIDHIIGQLAPEWPIEKITPIDVQILRIAILEGFIINITPEKVAIDEAIELTKEFSNDQSRKFVSGVLGTLIENKSKYLTSNVSK